jgi:hypothetical protein
MARPLVSPADVPVGRITTLHEIVFGSTRLRVDRDGATAEHMYFINDQRCDVNAYLVVAQAHLKSRVE